MITGQHEMSFEVHPRSRFAPSKLQRLIAVLQATLMGVLIGAAYVICIALLLSGAFDVA